MGDYRGSVANQNVYGLSKKRNASRKTLKQLHAQQNYHRNKSPSLNTFNNHADSQVVLGEASVSNLIMKDNEAKENGDVYEKLTKIKKAMQNAFDN